MKSQQSEVRLVVEVNYYFFFKGVKAYGRG